MRRTVVVGLSISCLAISACAARPARERRPSAEPPAAPRRAPAAGAPRDLAGKRAVFASAHRAFENADYAGAAASFEALLSTYPELEDYSLFYLASSFARVGRDAEALPLWERLATGHPESVHALQALLERGRALRRRGDLTGARDVLAQAENAGDEPIARGASFELAEIAEASGDPWEAHRRYAGIRRSVPGTTLGIRARERARALEQRDPSLAPRGALLEEELRLLVREGDHADAIALADRLLATAGPDERAALLRLRADAERASGDTERALATLEEIHRGHPGSEAGREALYDFASLLWNRDRDAEARRAFAEYERQYPGSRGAEVAYAIARIDQAAGDDRQATIGYERLARSYPSARQAAEARWRIAWIAYAGGRYVEAARAFADAAASGAAPQSESTYWQARALERGGQRAEAERIYRAILSNDPWSYYALQSERRLGHARDAGSVVRTPDGTPAIGSPPPQYAAAYHFVRARELAAIGLLTPARTELRAFERGAGGDAEDFLLESYPAVDGYRDAMRLAYETRRLEPRFTHPLAFWPLVSGRARDNAVDPLLVLALMRQESAFDPAARSGADARGLMQLLPSTAERIGGPIDGARLYDPSVNVSLGTSYLRQLLDRYGGDPTKALAAYNGGEAAVAKWVARFGHLEPDEFVECITYRETRDYVKKVLSNYRRYQDEYALR